PSPSMLSLRTIRRPSTGDFQTAVRTDAPLHCTSRGSPTFTESKRAMRTSYAKSALGYSAEVCRASTFDCLEIYSEAMAEMFSTEAVAIDLSTWERRSLFELFNGYSEPYHGVCLRVDCTETFRYAKDHRLSVFLALLQRSLLAANRTESFRLRVVDGAVLLYQTIHGGSAVGRPNGTIG